MTTSGDVTEATVMGLLPFTSYDCSVTANTSVGEGPPSIILTQRTVECGECVLHIWLMYMYNISVVYIHLLLHNCTYMYMYVYVCVVHYLVTLHIVMCHIYYRYCTLSDFG